MWYNAVFSPIFPLSMAIAQRINRFVLTNAIFFHWFFFILLHFICVVIETSFIFSREKKIKYCNFHSHWPLFRLRCATKLFFFCVSEQILNFATDTLVWTHQKFIYVYFNSMLIQYFLSSLFAFVFFSLCVCVCLFFDNFSLLNVISFCNEFFFFVCISHSK